MKVFIKSLDEVEEQFRSLYKQSGDGYVLNIDVKDHPEFKAVLSNRDEILDEKRKEAEKRRQAEADLEAAKREQNKGSAQTREEFEKVLADERAAHEKALEAERQAAADAKNQLRQFVIDQAVDTIARNLSGDDFDLIKPHIASRVDVVEADGKLKVVIKGDDGKPSGLTTEQFEADVRNNKKFERLIVGKQSSGAGSNGGGGNGTSEHEKYFDPKSPDFSLTKQIELEATDKAAFDVLSQKYDLSKV